MTSRHEYDPQKALLVDRPPTGDRWLHELKLDGYRMGLFIRDGAARMVSRRGNAYTSEYPEIIAAAKKLEIRSAVIDGEVVVLDEQGVSRFQMLQQIGKNRAGLAYFAFDILELNGKDLKPLPLEERKAQLEQLIAKHEGIIRYAAHIDADGRDVLARACALGAEGIVSKRRDAPYRIGSRSPDWQKIKCTKRQELVVGGFTDPEGSRKGVGSLLVGYYENGALRFAGKVGTGRGWSGEFSMELRRELDEIEIDRTPFDPRPEGWLGRNAHWVRPTLVVEVEFTEWTSGGHVRHPSLRGFRPDKPPRDVIRERETNTGTVQQPGQTRTSRLVYPKIRVREDDLIELYREIAEWVVPHVRGRPLTLVRLEKSITRDDALRTQAAFVHHTAKDQQFVNASVPRVQIREQKKLGEYVYVESTEHLLALVEAGVVEWHVWNACVDDVECPDRIVFDLDPGAGVEWPDVVAAARQLRAALRKHNLESWVKTTGGKGLHVVVPFVPEHDWDTVFELARRVATELVDENPERYTVTFSVVERAGKILVDYKRNYRTSIAIAGLSTRARPSGAMSVPVSWAELRRLHASDHWTVQNIRDRLRRLKIDPWKDYWDARQHLRV